MAANTSIETNETSECRNGLKSTPIAIVGMSCRFGGDVTNPSELWNLCASGGDGWSPIPGGRFDAESLHHPDGQRLGRVGYLV
jgi:acyl transferase domain-containing protein